MDTLHNPFKQALKSGRLQIGLWHSLSSHLAVEILADAGFDWILLDTEHAPNELPMVYHQLQAVDSGAAHPIVRPAWNDPVIIKRILDAGAQTLLVPMIQSADEARRLVASTRYPPRGIRGFASAARASGFGRIAKYHERCEAELCVLVQIETRHAVDRIEEIAAVEGVDGIFIGPGDLSADLGYLGQPGHPDVLAIVDRAVMRIKACDKPAGILVGADLARRYIDLGCLFVAVGSDIGLLKSGAQHVVESFGSLRRPA